MRLRGTAVAAGLLLSLLFGASALAQSVLAPPQPGVFIEKGTAENGQDRLVNPDGQIVAEPFANAADVRYFEEGFALVTDSVSSSRSAVRSEISSSSSDSFQAPTSSQCWRAD